MNDPRRLLQDEATEFEREALASWDAEAPSAEARSRALSLAAGLVGAGVAGATVSKIAATSIAPKGAALGTFALAKWILAGALVVALSALALVALLRPRPREAAPSSADAAPIASASAREVPRAEPRPEPEVTAPQPLAEPLPSASTAPPPRHSLVAPTASIAKRKIGTLTDEVAALDRANAALGGGDASEALRLVDAYEQDYPRPSLVEEATMLRVRALLKLGRRAEANELGDRFLDAHPTSAHAARLRQLLRPNP